jgi:serine/threonine protein kinase
MELCEGVRCDALVESGTLTTERAFALLDGVLAGLEAMHAVGVGHLDVKPSNIVLRRDVPVLVDFGLAGRHVRPGCATGCYGAPEIWGILAEHATPATADVYAFGCVAYEVLTGATLFDAPTEIALVSAHITHDGRPPQVAALARDARLGPLADLLARCLRHDPRNRARVSEVRARLAELAPSIAQLSWPLGR